MEIKQIIKSPVAIIGGIILVVIIVVMSRSKSGATTSSSGYDAARLAASQANASNAVQVAQINAGVDVARLQAGVETIKATLGGQAQLQSIDAQRAVALQKIASDENTTLQGLDYTYDISRVQLENNRILGLSQEDTKRLISTQENQTALQLGMSSLDTQRYLTQISLDSQERQQVQLLGYANAQLESNERISDFTSSRALTYANIQGQNQVAAIKASKPSAWSTFLGGLGQGVGGLLGGLF